MEENWKLTIKKAFDTHNDRKKEIHTALVEIISELRQEGLNMKVELTEEYPLTWEVNIHGKKIELTSEHVKQWQKISDDFLETEALRDVKVALQMMLVNRYKFLC